MPVTLEDNRELEIQMKHKNGTYIGGRPFYDGSRPY